VVDSCWLTVCLFAEAGVVGAGAGAAGLVVKVDRPVGLDSGERRWVGGKSILFFSIRDQNNKTNQHLEKNTVDTV